MHKRLIGYTAIPPYGRCGGRNGHQSAVRYQHIPSRTPVGHNRSDAFNAAAVTDPLADRSMAAALA